MIRLGKLEEIALDVTLTFGLDPIIEELRPYALFIFNVGWVSLLLMSVIGVSMNRAKRQQGKGGIINNAIDLCQRLSVFLFADQQPNSQNFTLERHGAEKTDINNVIEYNIDDKSSKYGDCSTILENITDDQEDNISLRGNMLESENNDNDNKSIYIDEYSRFVSISNARRIDSVMVLFAAVMLVLHVILIVLALSEPSSAYTKISGFLESVSDSPDFGGTPYIIFGSISLIFAVIASIAMMAKKKWGENCFMISVAGWILADIIYQGDVLIMSKYDVIFGNLYNIVAGVILMTIYLKRFMMQEERS
jgi:hypothetical protein